ncbi:MULTISPECIES: DMT family transporter [unclassified Vibrio]|uniref:DMT family transporter n=1 Tax=unclassified Vibrio TaxID=2614977 RepID=UPI001268CF50|nr:MULTISPECIES: DMT family transporter [unclassified Vibrio]QFT39923.1 EamA-like transporter family protein [Vibrio sp. THAF64]QGM37570.1 EamA-like transporter family protein [Vibrio sp. THAF191d]QGN73295.1 EamA-like transporter family protein [Vibrio sp. THAF191c]
MKTLDTGVEKRITHHVPAWFKKLLYVVCIGGLVAINFTLSKYAVNQGIKPIDVAVFPMVGAAALLMLMLVSQRQWRFKEFRHIRYYFFAGLLGVSLPNLASSVALQNLNASTFSVLVTLSPIFTLLFAIPFERSTLTMPKILAITVGVLAAMMVTITPSMQSEVDGYSVLIALLVPLLLGAGNVYRSRAFPANANPVALAAGMLALQSGLWLPAANPSILLAPSGEEWVLGVMAVNASLSYLLTFRFQQVTDGIGFSQVGNVVTVTGVLLGVLVYGEAITIELCAATLLLGASLYLFNKS